MSRTTAAVFVMCSVVAGCASDKLYVPAVDKSAHTQQEYDTAASECRAVWTRNALGRTHVTIVSEKVAQERKDHREYIENCWRSHGFAIDEQGK